MADAKLSRLQVLNPKVARTYCAETNTVEAYRKRVTRRADGTIVGYHDGAGTAWERYRMPLAEALKRRKAGSGPR